MNADTARLFTLAARKNNERKTPQDQENDEFTSLLDLANKLIFMAALKGHDHCVIQDPKPDKIKLGLDIRHHSQPMHQLRDYLISCGFAVEMDKYHYPALVVAWE